MKSKHEHRDAKVQINITPETRAKAKLLCIYYRVSLAQLFTNFVNQAHPDPVPEHNGILSIEPGKESPHD
jgi:hypothetical protein